MAELHIREALPSDDTSVLMLMTEYMTWALATFESTYGFSMEAAAEHTPASLHRFRRPRGLLALAEVDGMPAGVGAVRALNPDVVEIKRMYVRPEYRDAHLGSRMLDWLLDGSRDHFQAQIIRLDSNRFMGGAHRLYESRGFVERAPYEETDIPSALRHLWRFYERSLA